MAWNGAGYEFLVQAGDVRQKGIRSLAGAGRGFGDVLLIHQSGNYAGDSIPAIQPVEICVGDGNFLELGLPQDAFSPGGTLAKTSDSKKNDTYKT